VVEELCGFLDFSHSVGMLLFSNTAGKSAQPALSSMGQGKFHCWSVRVGEGSDILTQHCYSAAALLLATKVVSIVAEATVASMTLFLYTTTKTALDDLSFMGSSGGQLLAAVSRAFQGLPICEINQTQAKATSQNFSSNAHQI
jgi:hypothetical protein